MLKAALIYLAAASLITFILYGSDKLFARARSARVPERTLLFASVIGGAFGGLLGMLLFRHKTRKPRFLITNAFALILHVAAVVMITTIG